MVAAAGCGGGKGTGDGRGGPDIGQSAAGDVEALEPALAGLLDRHDEVLNQVLADPSVARDPGNPLVREYRSLYSPDSPLPERVIAAWVADAETGRVIRPVEPSHPAVASRIDGEIETVGDGAVRFPTCRALRYASYVAGGDALDVVPYREQPGQASAVRVDGRWRLLRLDALEGQTCCRTAVPPAPAPAGWSAEDTGAQCAAGAGHTAARALGYTTPAFSDDFTTFDEQTWTVYGGPSQHRYGVFPAQGGGRRRREQIDVAGGVMTITGLPNGDTAGMSTDDGHRQRYGLWEARVKLPSDAVNYHSVFMLMAGGSELDFAEAMEPTGRTVDSFLHFPGGAHHGQVTLSDNDWHNWAIEWAPTRITLYLDGHKWHETTDRALIPHVEAAMTIQLDWFTEDSGAESTGTAQLAVDWVRVYAPRAAQDARPTGNPQGCGPCPGSVDSLGQCRQGPGGPAQPGTEGCP